jgi:hypothetical protein
MNSSQEILNMILLCPESDLELNTKIIEYILIFPMTIYTPSYNQRFKSYKFWKLTELLKFRSGQNWVSHEIWTFYSKPIAIS